MISRAQQQKKGCAGCAELGDGVAACPLYERLKFSEPKHFPFGLAAVNMGTPPPPMHRQMVEKREERKHLLWNRR